MTRPRLETELTRILGLRAPVVIGPMTAVSEENLVVAAAEAGILAGLVPHNYPDVEAFARALSAVRSRTRAPFAVNLIVNRANLHLPRQLDASLDAGTPPRSRSGRAASRWGRASSHRRSALRRLAGRRRSSARAPTTSSSPSDCPV